MVGVLEEVRVLDFGRYIAGPFCAALLGDLGADVIRVERVDGGEDRFVVPVGEDHVGAMFLQCNRNKRGITLNPTTKTGRAVTQKLVEHADVVVANFPPKALATLGLDYDSLQRIKPDIILTTVNAFGDGALAEKLGFDGLAQAMSGNLHLSGHATEPMRAFSTYVDYSTAIACAMSTLAAILHREKTGAGQWVSGALLKSALTLMNPAIIEQQQTAIDRTGIGNRHPYSAPSDVFRTKDGWVMSMVLGEYQFNRWCEVVERPDLLTDDRFESDQKRGDNAAILCDVMQRWCAERTTEEVLDTLAAAKVPAGPVYSPQQVLDDENIAQLGLFEEQDYPSLPKAAPIAGFPVSLSVTPGTIRRPAPSLGEHTDEVLAEAGFDEDAISRLRDEGTI